MVEIKTPAEVQAMRGAGQVVAEILAAALGLSLEEIARACSEPAEALSA